AQVQRLVEALDLIGSPLNLKTRLTLEELRGRTNHDQLAKDLQEILDPLCLITVEINPESRVKVNRGAADAELVEQGWRPFLVKVQNDAGVTAMLRAESPNAARLAESPADRVEERWLDLAMFERQPLLTNLSGLKLEYRIIELY